MANVRKVKIGSTVYDVDDTTARTSANNSIKYDDTLQTTNPFGGKKLYISKIDDALYCAATRWTVTGSYTGKSSGSWSSAQLASLFDGSYEGGISIPAGCTATIRITFTGGVDGGNRFPGYPYGYAYLSYYYTSTPAQASKMRVYCNYEPHGIGVHEVDFSLYVGSYPASSATAGNSGLVEVARNGFYDISYMEFEIKAHANFSCTVTNIELKLDRPDSSRTPFLSKYGSEVLYNPLTIKSTLNATTVQENGTNLSSKYLGITAKATDSDKLDNHDSSYFAVKSSTTSSNGSHSHTVNSHTHTQN